MTETSLLLFLAIWTLLAAALGGWAWSYLTRSIDIGRIGNFRERWIVREESPAKFAAVAGFYKIFITIAFVFAILGLAIAVRQVWIML